MATPSVSNWFSLELKTFDPLVRLNVVPDTKLIVLLASVTELITPTKLPFSINTELPGTHSPAK